MGERSGQPGSHGSAPVDARRSRGLETHARSSLERRPSTGAGLGRVESEAELLPTHHAPK